MDPLIKSEIEEFFGGSIPLVFRILDQKGMLSVYWPVVREAFLDPGISDPFVKEGIALSVSLQCENEICFISHALSLYGQGLSVDEVRSLIKTLNFPSYVKECEKWNQVIKWSYLNGLTRKHVTKKTRQSFDTLRAFLNEAEYRAVCRIHSAVELMMHFTLHYSDEVNLDSMDYPRDSCQELIFPVPDFIKYYTERRNPSDERQPVVTICMYCKDIQDRSGEWHALEGALRTLDMKSAFSHGMCPECYEKIIAQPHSEQS
jgi:hypothetical protein